MSLRERAEQRFRANTAEAAHGAVSSADLPRLVKELQVHQAELEMQNEELTRAKLELEEARDRYRDLFDYSRAGGFILEADGTILEANSAAKKLLGVSRSRLLGRRLGVFLAEAGRPAFAALLDDVMAERPTAPCVVRVEPAARSGAAPVFVQLDGLAAAGGSTCRLVMVDVTELEEANEALRRGETETARVNEALRTEIAERRRVEEAFLRNDENLRLAQRAAGVGIWRWDIPGGHLDWTPELFRLYGLDPGRDEANFDTWYRVLHPDDRETVRRAGEASLERKVSFGYDYRIIRPDDGHVRWIRAIGDYVQDAAGQPVHMAGVSIDVTEHKRMEDSLRESTTRFRRFFEQPLIGTCITSPTKGWLEVNDRLCRMLGYAREEFEALTWAELTHPDDLDADVALYESVLKGERDGYSMEKRFLRKDGTPFPAEMSVGCIRRPDGSVDYFVALIQDISERRRAQEELAESRDLLREIAENSLALIYVVDTEGRFLLANRRLREVFGGPAGEIVGRKREAFLPEAVAAAHCANDLRIAGERVCQTFEETDGTGDGAHTYLTMKYPLLRRDGTLYAIGGMSIDITARARAESALRESEKQFRLLAENATDVIGVFGTDGVVRYASPACRAMTGYEQDEVIGRRISEMYLPEDRPVVERAMARHETGEPVVRVRYRVTRKNGRVIWVERITRAIRDPEGKGIVEFQFVVRDVTEAQEAEEEVRRHRDRLEEIVAERTGALVATNVDLERIVSLHARAEKNLRASEERLRLAQQVGRSGTFDWDLRTNGILWTPELEGLYGLAPGGFEGNFAGWERRVHEEDLEPVNALIRQAVENRTDFHGEFRITRADGRARWIEGVGRVVCDEAGQPLRMVGLNRDVTERRELEESLRESNRDLEQFAFVASHDLQQPLRMVASFVERLAMDYSGKLDEAADTYIRIASENSHRMSQLIRDLLAYSRIGGRGREFAPTSAAEALREALLDLQAPIQEHGAEVSSGDLPSVCADRVQLVQLFQNLVGNAVKFHGERPPRVRVEAGREAGRWHFTVADNGIGIEPKYHDRVFVIFQRLHAPGSYEGTGIGLPVCKRIVERHGGRIWVESGAGGGTVFHFTIGDRGGPA